MDLMLSAFQERVSRRARKERIPLNCLFELTPTCNLRCRFCYVALDPYKGPYLSTAQICVILDKIAEAGVLWLTLTGGEIFSRRDFAAIYQYARSKGFLVTLYSNATLVNESIAKLLKEQPPFNMEVSIYGADAEHYEGTTGIPGSFERFKRGIDLLNNAGVPLVLKTPFSTLTQDHAPAILEFCRSRGIPFRYDFAMDNRHSGDGEPSVYRIQPRRVRQMFDEMWEQQHGAKREGPLPECSITDPDYNGDLYQCGAGRVGFFVDALGNASHCVIDRQPSFNLLEHSWSEVWKGMGDWVTQKLPEDAPCQGCSLRGTCHNCPARSRLATGSPFLKDTYYCDVTHVLHGLEPAEHPDYRAIAARKLGACVG
jgi:radical SAM protein with 4Fe4S-binding SPASM domain